MPNSSSFDKEYYNKLKTNIVIHKLLVNLTSANIEKAVSFLSQNNIFTTKENIAVLARSFIDIASFYTKNIEPLVELFICLLRLQSKDNYLHLLPDLIVKCIHTRENLRMSALFFLRKLFLRRAVYYNSIINEINKLPPFIDSKHSKIKLDPYLEVPFDIEEELEENENIQGPFLHFLSQYSHSNNKKMKVLMMFYPEIREKNKNFEMNHVLNVASGELLSPEEFHQEMNDGYNSNPLAEIIRNDDIDSFVQIASKSNDTDFINTRIITKRTFDRFPILSHQPTLIQYAAFFNSIKIFKYLLLNNADTDEESFRFGFDQFYSLAHFAVSGGSTEIIRILEQRKFSLATAIVTAIKSYQNDILIYLLDNHFPKTHSDFISMDYERIRQIDEKKSQYARDEFEFSIKDIYDYDCFYYEFDQFHLDGCSIETTNNYDDDDEEEDRTDREKSKYFNFYAVFQAIVESNNLLALFTLYDYGMKINARDQQCKKTLLHFAVEKGKTFIFKLLITNKFINPFLEDKNGESAIVYTLKYGRESFFFEMMKNEKIVNSLKQTDYIKLAHYAVSCGLQKAKDFLLNTWKFDLLNLIEINEIDLLCNIVKYAPIEFLLDQIKPFLTETFLCNYYILFVIFAVRIANEYSINIKADFYYIIEKDDLPPISNLFYRYKYELYSQDLIQSYRKSQSMYQHYNWEHERGAFSDDGYKRFLKFQFHKIKDSGQKEPYVEITFKFY